MKIIIKILKIINKIFYPSFNCPKDLLVVTFKNIFIQKIIGVNRQVKWPVHKTSTIIKPNNIIPGTRCPGLSKYCNLDGRNGIVIGKNVWVGPSVSIISQNHNINDFTKYVKEKPIVIGDNCWIGTKVTILAGVNIANHTIIAAGSVVTKSFEESDIIIGGVPAKKIKSISKYKESIKQKKSIYDS